MKIKVLHILETVTSGGVEQRRLLLARYLDAAKYEQIIVCTFAEGPLVEEIRAFGVPVIAIGRFRSIFSLTQYLKILKIIRAFRPHIIHGAVFEGVTMATIAGSLGRVPVVIAEETSDPQNRTWRGHLLLRMLTMLADYVVGISPTVVKYLKGNGVPERKIRLINNGVKVPEPISEERVRAIRQKLALVDGDFLIGSVGRLRDFHKRFSDLIEATSILKDELPIKLLIIGEGDDKALLQRLALEKGIADRVIFAGYQYDPGPYYKCMDVFALASHMEGFGLVLIEAMLFKLPVVATAVGGIVDIIVPDTTGFLVKTHSPQSFVNKFRQLYSDRSLGRHMGEKGYERAMLEYTASVYTKNVEQLYQEGIENKRVQNR